MLSSLRSWVDRIFYSSAGETLRGKALRLNAIYRSLDKEIFRFKAASRIACPSPCGQCCVNSTVEASELEMLPMAFELVRLGKADEWYGKAEAKDFEGQCVFYSSNDLLGQCSYYAFRPLVCRLFGFAGNRDKYGRPRLVTCGRIKKEHPLGMEQVLENVASGRIVPPMMSDLVMRVSSVDPALSRESIPVNMAFKKAVERVLLGQQLSRGGF